jgi:hypothetical protein
MTTRISACPLTMAASLACALMTSCSASHPANLPLFTYAAASEIKPSPGSGKSIISLDAAPFGRVAPIAHVSFSLRGRDYVAKLDHIDDFDRNGKVWIGNVESCLGPCRVFVAMHGRMTVASIDVAEGHFEATAEGGVGELLDFDRLGIRNVVPKANDYLLPLPSKMDVNAKLGSQAEGAPAPDNPSVGIAKIDVRFVADQDYLLGNNAGYARMALVFSKMKQAFVDSGVSATFSYMGETIPIINSAQISDETILERITPKTAAPPVPASPRSFIDTHRGSADLVIMIRKYRGGVHCGVAWIGGKRASPNQAAADLAESVDWAYGVVDDGKIGAEGCSEYTLAHEIGHIFGSMHDWQTEGATNVRGAFDESFGHRGGAGANRFFTIMGYPDGGSKEVGVFSNPALRAPCFGYPCGIATGPFPANDAKGYNAVRFKVASWRGPWEPIEVVLTGGGSGRVTGTLENGTATPIDTQLNCPGACLTTADEGHEMTLVATPDSGSRFAGWVIDENIPHKCSTPVTCLLYVRKGKITARFDRQ